jgi:dienelactone hydrolase
MKSDGLMGWLSRLICAVCVLAAPGVAVAQTVEYFVPASGKGPAVVLVSGATGVALYQDFGRAIAGLGYVGVLVNGSDVYRQPGDGPEKLVALLASVRSDPRVQSGKVGVIGFSLGGSAVLVNAIDRPEEVAAVVAYYPGASRLPSIPAAARRVAVPTLLIAGEADRFNDCCLIASIREYEAVARASGAAIALVSYKDANHGFNLRGPTFRADDAADAWAKTRDFLNAHLPLR